jgi:transcriptional regulator with XRE-family HTH domain
MSGEHQAEMMPGQCRAARGLLNWTQQKLAEVAEVRISAVISFERNWRVATLETIQAMRLTLEAAGVEFTNGDEPGVKLKAKGKRK